MNGRDLFWVKSETGAEARAGQILGFVLGLGFWAGLLGWAFSRTLYVWNWPLVFQYKTNFIEGWISTVWLSLLALVLSLVFGATLTAARRAPFLPLRYFSRIYVQIVRGTPLLVQLLVSYYFITHALALENRYVVGAVTLALFSGAYISEIIRGGLESVENSQKETARALGLSRAQTYRYVICPQALRQALPALTGQLLLLVKDSSLLSVLGIYEFTQSAQLVNARTYNTVEGYLVLAVGYLVLTLPLSWLTKRLEARFRYET